MGCIAILSMGESKVFFDDGPAFSEFQLNPSLDDLTHTSAPSLKSYQHQGNHISICSVGRSDHQGPMIRQEHSCIQIRIKDRHPTFTNRNLLQSPQYHNVFQPPA